MAVSYILCFGMATSKQVSFYFFVACVVGLLLSCYALYVEIKKEENKDYGAYCDINEYISCSKAFSSEYGKGFGIIGSIFGKDSVLNQPNSIGGVIFYFLMAVLSFSDHNCVVKFQIVCCVFSNLMSIYLAYILYFILHDLCVVCVSTYVINAINLGLSIAKDEALSNEKKEALKKK